jgi:putative transposase
VPESSTRYPRHRFPIDVISYAVWLYFRFTLSFRDVQEILFERGIQVSNEAVRLWCQKFGTSFAEQLKRRERKSGSTWHLDEVFVKIGGRQVYLWRAVDEHGQVLDILVQEKRDTDAAERFFRRLLTEVSEPPERIITDKLGSYGAAKAKVSELQVVEHLQVRSDARLNNRVEQSHQPTRQRERRMQGFPSLDAAQLFLSSFSRFCNHFRLRRHLLCAPQYRQVLRERFAVWHEVIGNVVLN